MITSRIRKRGNQSIHLYGKLIAKVMLFLIFIVTLYFAVDKFKTFFPIKSVKVFGVQHIDQTSIQEAITPLVKKGFFAIDVDIIKDRLLKSPWVSKTIVQRVWPDQVIITVIEKTPIARWNNESLLSTNGEIFSPPESSYPQGLPLLIGPDREQIRMLEYYKKLSSILMPLHFKIARFELTPELAWNLTFDNGIKVTAGYKDILTHINHFVKVYPKIVGDKDSQVEYIDLRYPNGLAIRWKTTS